jgi:putative nucleotidyltransferase with HDIG domain
MPELDDEKTERLRRITEKIIGLPTLPIVVTKLIELVGNPKTSAGDLDHLISADQALSAKILKVSNSAFYGFPRKIVTIKWAIVVLGFEAVKNLGLSVALLERFPEGESHELFDRQQFWTHSIGCGAASRLLARRIGYRREAEAFVAGILHDLGKLILVEYFQDKFLSAVRLARSEDLYIAQAEEIVLGVSHAEVGGWLAEKWNLPREIVEVIARHHGPFPDDEDEEAGAGRLDLTYIVHAADALCRRHRIGNSGDSRGPALHPHVARVFQRGREVSEEDLFEHLGAGLEREIERAEIFRRWSEGPEPLVAVEEGEPAQGQS